MAKKEKERARQRRFELMFLLGGVCAKCGTDRNLEFDCIIPCGDEHHRMDTSHRMSFYYRQHREGNLQILCRKHNNAKSVQDALSLNLKQGYSHESTIYPF